MTGIEPAYSAWEADVLPLNYIGAVAQKASTRRHACTPDTASLIARRTRRCARRLGIDSTPKFGPLPRGVNREML